jgi:hypothetical protein
MTTSPVSVRLSDIRIGDRIHVRGNGGALGLNGKPISRGFAIEVTTVRQRYNQNAWMIAGLHLTTTGTYRKGLPIRYAELTRASGGANAQWDKMGNES